MNINQLRLAVEFIGHPSSTPTAAPAADRPTSLSSFLVLPSLTLPAPYFPAHTSDTTSTGPPNDKTVSTRCEQEERLEDLFDTIMVLAIPLSEKTPDRPIARALAIDMSCASGLLHGVRDARPEIIE